MSIAVTTKLFLDKNLQRKICSDLWLLTESLDLMYLSFAAVSAVDMLLEAVRTVQSVDVFLVAV